MSYWRTGMAVDTPVTGASVVSGLAATPSGVATSPFANSWTGPHPGLSCVCGVSLNGLIDGVTEQL
jgi:hypothetical protein